MACTVCSPDCFVILEIPARVSSSARHGAEAWWRRTLLFRQREGGDGRAGEREAPDKSQHWLDCHLGPATGITITSRAFKQYTLLFASQRDCTCVCVRTFVCVCVSVYVCAFRLHHACVIYPCWDCVARQRYDTNCPKTRKRPWNIFKPSGPFVNNGFYSFY